ncbi:MAG: vacuolar import/degradation protein Vid24, partial [Linnemannia elongata]
VNLKDSSLCGYLHIRGLTDEYPELTTFFDAEIIGNAYSFVTKKWDAKSKTDKEHWTLFKPFEPMCDIFTNDDFKYDFQNKDVIFMRWKEHFLVPDHRVEGITGASFAGFYYICYNMSKGEIEGYYYHQSSEK